MEAKESNIRVGRGKTETSRRTVMSFRGKKKGRKENIFISKWGYAQLPEIVHKSNKGFLNAKELAKH